MAKRIQFEGATHEFPDDFTDAEIATALKSAHPQGNPMEAQAAALLQKQGLGAPAAPNTAKGLNPITNPLASAGVPEDQAKRFAKEATKESGQDFGATLATPLSLIPGAGALPAIARGVASGAAYLGGRTLMGDTPTGGEAATTMALSAGIPAVGAAVRGARNLLTVRNVNNPVEEAALQSVEGKVPMSVGQRTGSRGLQRVEQQLENFPGSSSQTQKFYANQQDALAEEGSRLAAQPIPVQANEVGAGQSILDERLPDRINKMKSQANKLYDQVRAAAAANKKTVQVGTKESAILDAAGNPVTVPVTKTLETPVDLRPIREQLAPLYRDLTSSMPVARRDASPAFAALKELMENPQAQMDAMDFDRSLGAIKSLARDGQNPYLTSQSQRVAKQVVAAGEKELQGALRGAGPDVQGKLQTARNLVKGYHDTGELLASLNDEPAALYKNLTTGGDKSFGTLQELNKVAPKQVKIVGRTFLEGLMQKATNEGGFARGAGIMADWNRLGPEAKKLMFGEQLTGDLDNFLLAAKRLTTDRNPSGTAHSSSAALMFKAAQRMSAEAAAGVAMGHPFAGAAAAAADMTGTVAAGIVAPKIAAKLLFTPGGARLMTRAITAAPNSPAFNAAVTTLNQRILALQSQQ